jgi:hypothetical protein
MDSLCTRKSIKHANSCGLQRKESSTARKPCSILEAFYFGREPPESELREEEFEDPLDDELLDDPLDEEPPDPPPDEDPELLECELEPEPDEELEPDDP